MRKLVGEEGGSSGKRYQGGRVCVAVLRMKECQCFHNKPHSHTKSGKMHMYHSHWNPTELLCAVTQDKNILYKAQSLNEESSSKMNYYTFLVAIKYFDLQL